MIVIVDYGLGNLGSILNMLRKLGVESIISSAPDDIVRAQRLILPGVGAFDTGMINLRTRGLEEVLSEKVIQNKAPCLGICLGMQLLMGSSEEGQESGLGWIAGRTRKFSFEQREPARKVPHMGWNAVQVKQPNPLFLGLDGEFFHSHGGTLRRSGSWASSTSSPRATPCPTRGPAGPPAPRARASCKIISSAIFFPSIIMLLPQVFLTLQFPLQAK